MHESKRLLTSRLSRRALLGSSAALATVASAVATKQVAGEISVGYDGSNELLSTYIEQTAEFIETENPGAKVNLLPAPGGGFTTQLFLQLASGKGPDVFLFSGVGIGEFATAGFVAPLDSYLETWEGWTQYPEAIKASLIYNDSTWAVPTLIDTHFLYYRRDLFEQAGLSPDWAPASPNDILAAAREIKTKVENVIPYALYAGANGGNSTVARGFVPLVYGYGGTLQTPEGKIVIESCAIQDALDHYYVAYQVDETVPTQVMTDPDPPASMRQAMGAGELGILCDGCWTYGPWYDEDPEGTSKNVGFILFPNIDGPPFSVGGLGNSWYLNSKAKDPDLGWAFIAAFNSKENQVAINSTDPHIPPRADAAADPAFQATPFLQAMVASSSSLLLTTPDPALRQVIGVVQNATGLVATGEATPQAATTRYAEELTRLLGPDKVVSEPCSQ